MAVADSLGPNVSMVGLRSSDESHDFDPTLRRASMSAVGVCATASRDSDRAGQRPAARRSQRVVDSGPNRCSRNNLGNKLRATETNSEARNPIGTGSIN